MLDVVRVRQIATHHPPSRFRRAVLHDRVAFESEELIEEHPLRVERLHDVGSCMEFDRTAHTVQTIEAIGSNHGMLDRNHLLRPRVIAEIAAFHAFHVSTLHCERIPASNRRASRVGRTGNACTPRGNRTRRTPTGVSSGCALF